MRPASASLFLVLFAASIATTANAAATAADSVVPKPAVAAPRTKDATDKDLRSTIAQLKAGLKTGEVRDLLGVPEKRVRKKDTPVGPVEAWIYRSKYVAAMNHIQTGVQTYQRPNPITNVMETVNEPIYGMETIRVVEEHVIVFKDGRLIEWKTTVADRTTTISG